MSSSMINYPTDAQNAATEYKRIAAEFVVLLPPKGLKAKSLGGRKVEVTWDKKDYGQDGFVIERKRTDATEFERVGKVDANTNTFVDSTPEVGKSYSYRVRSFNKPGGFRVDSEYDMTPEVAVS